MRTWFTTVSERASVPSVCTLMGELAGLAGGTDQTAYRRDQEEKISLRRIIILERSRSSADKREDNYPVMILQPQGTFFAALFSASLPSLVCSLCTLISTMVCPSLTRAAAPIVFP